MTNIYDDLVSSGRYFLVDQEPFALSMTNHQDPVSIKLSEFNYITDTIVQGNCKRGYEIATGFGISSLAAGFGLKQNGGKIVTIDSYVEEKYKRAGFYKEVEKELF
jgi:hypothetical protein